MDTLLLKALERTGCGGILLSIDGNVVAINESACDILRNMFGREKTSVDSIINNGRNFIKQLLSQGKTRIQLDSENWVLIERIDQRPLIMHAVPSLKYSTCSETKPHTMLILIDLENVPQVSSGTLERLFGLTPAEIRLAMLLISGLTTSEAADFLNIRVATARSQLASIFSKTRTTRQAELVRLLSRLAILP